MNAASQPKSHFGVTTSLHSFVHSFIHSYTHSPRGLRTVTALPKVLPFPSYHFFSHTVRLLIDASLSNIWKIPGVSTRALSSMLSPSPGPQPLSLSPPPPEPVAKAQETWMSLEWGAGEGSEEATPECPHIHKLCPFIWRFTTGLSVGNHFHRSPKWVTPDNFRTSVPGDNEEENQKIHTGAEWSHQNICLTSALVTTVRLGHNWWHCSWS